MKKATSYTITGKVWIYPSEKASWHFITIPKNESKEITENYKAFKNGWGSLPVVAEIGKTEWKTSIFPDTKSGTYILPLKALIRRKEGIFDGDTVKITIAINS